MGLANWLGLGSEVAEPIRAIGGLYTTDKDRLAAENAIEQTLQQGVKSQLEVNKFLALSTVFFNSGWQSLIGWTCGFLILIYYAPQIIVAQIVWGSACLHSGVVTPFPISSKELLNLVWLLFGFGGYHLINKKVRR